MSELNFTRLQNRLINSDCVFAQRFPTGVSGTGAASSAIDQFNFHARDTNAATSVAAGSFVRETSNIPKGSKSAVKLGLTSGGLANVINFNQRIEVKAMSGLESSKVTFQVKLKRLGVGDLDSSLVCFVQAATAPDTFTLFAESAALVVPLIKKGTTADATLGDVSTTDFEVFFGSFEVPNAAYINGMEVSLGLSRPALDFFTTVENKLIASQFALTETGILSPWQPAAQWFPGLELQLCQRYFEPFSFEETRIASIGQCFSTTQAFGDLTFAVEKRAIPTASFTGTVGDFKVTNAAGTTVTATNLTFSRLKTRSAEWIATVASGLVAGNATSLFIEVTGTRILISALI